MCISTVHYCCHRNVMRSASYRPTQLNGKSCLICVCSGIFILILFWKGIVNTVWRGRRGRGKERMKEQESRRRLDPPHLSFHHSFLSLSLLCLVCPLAVSVNWWLSYTQVAVTLYYAHTAISAINMWPSVCLYHWLVMDEWCFQRHWDCWFSLCGDQEEFYLRWNRHWSYLGSGVFINQKKENCIAFIPADHMSSCIDFVHL